MADSSISEEQVYAAVLGPTGITTAQHQRSGLRVTSLL
jgi:hypothetical protein